ncbi:MAG: Rieske 2Fe-2S domain-containing protein [Streptosporangiales bacterium]|nr:Rieske 2Fe-2S domain-containing protein [Streptosporangiales bacterium]
MLRADDNEILTRTGPGTLMGNLLRRYWTPACLSAEIPDPGGAPVRARLLGENLVAFRGTDGRIGLVQENCPHRGASLHFGRNEDAAIRCVYHGWAFDADGRCVDMPSEPVPFCEKVRMRAYPVRESGGIVWAYLGPRETMTPFRDFGTGGAGAEEFIAAKQHTTCNWVQSMEGNIDTAHVSHLHQFDQVDDIPDDGSDKPGYPSNAMSWKFWRHDRAPRLDIEDTWYGYRYAGIRTTPNGHTHVRVTAYALPYSTMVASIPFSAGHGMFVPIDDENCWRYILIPKARRNPRNLGGENLFAAAPFSTPITGRRDGVTPREYTAGNDYLIDRDYAAHGIFSGVRDFVSQDLMVTESMGPVYDRTQEHLGSTDKAISRMRHLLLSAAKGLAEGKEPPALAGDFTAIRGAEKILEPGEDWRGLGTDADPVVREAFGRE